MKKIAESSVGRLVDYHRLLAMVILQGKDLISSQEIAEQLGIKATQVRKDLSYFGEIGKRGVGYKTRALYKHLDKILDTPKRWRVALVGVGNLGTALIGHSGFRNDKFELAALFDISPGKVGRKFYDIECFDAKELTRIVQEKQIEVIVLTVPDSAAQRCVDMAAESGCLKGVLSFTSASIMLPKGIIYQRVDMYAALEKLFFYLKSKENS